MSIKNQPMKEETLALFRDVYGLDEDQVMRRVEKVLIRTPRVMYTSIEEIGDVILRDLIPVRCQN